MEQLLVHVERGRVPRYILAFGACLGLQAVVFHATRSLWVHIFMLPLTGIAQVCLSALGLSAEVGGVNASEGICLLSVGHIVYRVTFECTGIFALFLCTASILAFPVALTARLKGLLLVVPAFCAYAALRLVVLGVVAHVAPAYIELFHLYIMVVANIGFVLALWLYWLQGTVEAESS